MFTLISGTFFIFLGVYISTYQFIFGVFVSYIFLGTILITLGWAILNLPIELLIVCGLTASLRYIPTVSSLRYIPTVSK